MKSQFSITKFLNRFLNRIDLSSNEAQQLMEEILAGKLTPVQTASILIALRMKQESAEEILGFITVMRNHMLKIKTSGLVIDTCGTGGDGKGTLNISTAAAFVVAGAGVKVAKHGNRAASSRCGSADVLEALGVNIKLDPTQAAKVLEEAGMVFLFAPLFHPALKNVASVRKELGIRTVFNYLGPLVNPAGVKRQLVGVPDQDIARKLAEAATKLDYKHILFVTSEDETDEITLFGKSLAISVKGKLIKEFVINPKDFGFKTKYKDGIRGGTAKVNAGSIEKLLSGAQGLFRETVILNSATAVYVAGRVNSIAEGIPLTIQSIDSGRASQVLERLRKV